MITAGNPEWPKLLLSLKVTVEGLLVHQVANVWSIYGGLNRLHTAVENIFKHGCKTITKEGKADCWGFIQGLSWLQPSSSISISAEAENCNNLPASIKNDKSMLWIYKTLEQHSFSEKLSWLISDSNHLACCYEDYAFLRQPKYAEATVLCLKAVEQNQPSLLTELNPSLYVIDLNYNKFQKYHRRCSSLPDSKCKFFQNIRERNSMPKELEMPVFPARARADSIEKKKEETTVSEKKSNSLPDLTDESVYGERIRSKTVVSNKISPSVLKVEYNPPKKAESEEKKNFRYKKKRPIRREESKEWFVVQGKKEEKERKKTFMEDGGTSVLPMSTGYFPRPVLGQSLTSFLSSEQFSRASAELDRENAHFSVCEAMISVIEQMKCNRELRLAEDANEEESDEEINSLKQRIRLRRRQRFEEKQLRHLWNANLLSDGKTDTTTTDQSVSPLSTSPETPSDSISTDDVDDLEVDEANNMKELRDSELSVSMASLYSEADLSKTRREPTESTASAENVALSLLRQFKEKQLPRASDLEWLVSEEDAPQELLPLPKSWPVSPDDADLTKTSTPLRGTSDWAPPRAQVIFTLHPSPVRRILLGKQNSRCAGCGLRVQPEYAHKFRYCEYLGRYFCTGCHSNQLAVIPGRILSKWDFNRYPVSTFSYRLLDQMSTDPLFPLNDLNSNIYKKVKQLDKVRQSRLQLFYLKDFLLTCRFAEQLQDDLKKEPPYILQDPDMYSLNDLIQVKTGEMLSRLRELVKDGLSHVANCQLCQARGFVCELCPSKEVIFPWFISKVSRCSKCGSCFHLQCFKSGFCPRCARVGARRQSQIENDF